MAVASESNADTALSFRSVMISSMAVQKPLESILSSAVSEMYLDQQIDVARSIGLERTDLGMNRRLLVESRRREVKRLDAKSG